jgi:hypothetical protein
MKRNNIAAVLPLLFVACELKNTPIVDHNEIILEYTPTLLTKKEALEFRLSKIQGEKQLFEKMYKEIQSPKARETIYFKIRELRKEEDTIINQLYSIQTIAEENAVKKQNSLLNVKDDYLDDKSLQGVRVSYPFFKQNGEPILYPSMGKFEVVGAFKWHHKFKEYFDEKNVWRVYVRYPQVLDGNTPAGFKFHMALRDLGAQLNPFVPEGDFLMDLAKEIFDKYGITDNEILHYKYNYQRPDHVLKWNKNVL